MKKNNAKQRLLDTATELFTERGYLAVGINEIIEKSETAKASFYQYFKSKDLLCAEWLSSMHQRSEIQHESILRDRKTTEKKVREYFAYLKDWLGKNDFRGCPYTNTAAVLAGGSLEIRAEIERHKLYIRDFFIELARGASSGNDARTLGNTWFILYSGSTTEAQNLRSTWPVDAALDTALTLLQQVQDRKN